MTNKEIQKKLKILMIEKEYSIIGLANTIGEKEANVNNHTVLASDGSFYRKNSVMRTKIAEVLEIPYAELWGEDA